MNYFAIVPYYSTNFALNSDYVAYLHPPTYTKANKGGGVCGGEQGAPNGHRTLTYFFKQQLATVLAFTAILKKWLSHIHVDPYGNFTSEPDSV